MAIVLEKIFKDVDNVIDAADRFKRMQTPDEGVDRGRDIAAMGMALMLAMLLIAIADASRRTALGSPL